MRRIPLKEGYGNPVCIALGFFDCVHIGHIEIMNFTIISAKEHGAESAVFTFSNNPFETFRFDVMPVLTFEERCAKLNILGLKNLIYTEFDSGFMSLTKEEFLDTLTDNFNIRALLCGADYRFGRNKEGDVDYLKQFCRSKNVELKVVPTVEYRGIKASSSSCRDALVAGDISTVNALLGFKYAIKGEIEQGKRIATGFGFPTANIFAPKNKQLPKLGVYKTSVEIDGKKYTAVTNVGAKPTFDDKGLTVESHIVGYSGDLYGKTLCIEFESYIRDIIKFGGKNELAVQIAADIKEALK